jgi:hypothetical protein
VALLSSLSSLSLSLLLLLLLSLLLLSPLLGSLVAALLVLFRGFCRFCGVTGAALCLLVGFFFCLLPAFRVTDAAGAVDLLLLGFSCLFFVVADVAPPPWDLFHIRSAAAVARGDFLIVVARIAKTMVSAPVFAQQAVATQPKNDRHPDQLAIFCSSHISSRRGMAAENGQKENRSTQ